MNRALHIIIAAAALLAGTAPAAENPWTVYTEWPFDAAEAKRRQQETADALNIPVKKTITVGKDKNGLPVTMGFMLIPAGAFVMGTPEPVSPVEPPDDAWIGWACATTRSSCSPPTTATTSASTTCGRRCTCTTSRRGSR